MPLILARVEEPPPPPPRSVLVEIVLDGKRYTGTVVLVTD